MRQDSKAKLKLILGSHHSEIWIGPVRIFVAPEEMPPFIADAVAAEEDTYLVLSADPEVPKTDEPPERIMAEAFATQPEAPGSVIAQGEHPLQFLAIVHDLNQDPSWKEEWVGNALEGIFREVENRKLQSLALPLLGTVRGSLDKSRFIALLREALERRLPSHLKRLWLVVPAGATRQVLEILKADLPG